MGMGANEEEGLKRDEGKNKKAQYTGEDINASYCVDIGRVRNTWSRVQTKY